MMAYIAACQHGSWHLRVQVKGQPETGRVVPYACRSWRHEGPCRHFRGAMDYVRIRDAMQKHQNWSHITLTFEDHKTVNAFRRYKEGYLHWSVLRKRIIREFGPIRYIQTWERHVSGIPHCHIAVSNFYMYHEATGSALTNWWRMLRKDAMEVGFGRRGWLEPLRPGHHFASYLTKLAQELIGGGKKDQTPDNAPSHFRRIRATQRLLDPPHKDPDLTGRLFFCPAGSIEGLDAADAPEQGGKERGP